MEASASMTMNATKSQVWAVVTDIARAKEHMSCILDLEILEQPASGLVGLKWKETREMFGKQAVETMWITEAKENEFYVTEAINSGCIYHSTVSLGGSDGNVELKMNFKATPQTLMAKLMSPLMLMMKGMIRKAYLKDLEDIKAHLAKA